MILDADLTVPPEDLPRFYDAWRSGKADFVNGVRLVYPMENRAMRFFNLLGNRFFSLTFTWLLNQNIQDTLCGTKVLSKRHYEVIAANRSYFGEFDPFGDFDLLFGAAKLQPKDRGPAHPLCRTHLWRHQHPALAAWRDSVANGFSGHAPHEVHLKRLGRARVWAACYAAFSFPLSPLST